jgi:hypothetical protein
MQLIIGSALKLRERESTYLGVVVLPDAARDAVAAEVEGLEPDLADAQLLRRRVLRRRVLDQPLHACVFNWPVRVVVI